MIQALLQKHGLLTSDEVTLTPLSGGVSSDIFLVEDGEKKFVIKQALATLRVADEWHANISRNMYEQRYIRYVGKRFPQWTPKLLASFEQDNLFAMEFLAGDYLDWKKALLRQKCSGSIANTVGEALGAIHHCSWGCEEAEQRFDSVQNFQELRLSPYFESLIPKHPELEQDILSLCQRIRSTKTCLVHGDYSPKNILVSQHDIKIIDCEVAWYEDPVFDLAFMINHLVIKSIHFQNPEFVELAKIFYQAYRNALRAEMLSDIDPEHLCKTISYLMLARVDGKSPVEYLDKTGKDEVRRHALEEIKKEDQRLYELIN